MVPFWTSNDVLEKTKLLKQWFLGTRSGSKRLVAGSITKEFWG